MVTKLLSNCSIVATGLGVQEPFCAFQGMGAKASSANARSLEVELRSSRDPASSETPLRNGWDQDVAKHPW